MMFLIFEERDGVSADPNQIFLTAGASQGVQAIMQLMSQHDHVGIMIPIPQYPLYSATLALNSAHGVTYYLDEKNGWDLPVSVGNLKQVTLVRLQS
jgi:alanine transaminase